MKLKTEELESLQKRNSYFFGINQKINVFSVIIEVTSLQTTFTNRNKQIEELRSKLDKKDEIVKELESIQERKSYVTLQLN